MSDTLRIFTDVWGQLSRLPFAALLAIFILVIGLMMKRTPAIHNGLIPWVTLIVGTLGYTVLGDPTKVTSVAAGWRQYVILGFYGTILGFGVWMMHRFILKRFEKFLPAGVLPIEEFDTKPPFPPDGGKTDQNQNVSDPPKV